MYLLSGIYVKYRILFIHTIGELFRRPGRNEICIIDLFWLHDLLVHIFHSYKVNTNKPLVIELLSIPCIDICVFFKCKIYV